MMTKKEIDAVIMMGHSHAIPGYQSFPLKFHMFRAIKEFLKGEMYWYALLEVHQGSDNLYALRAEIKEAFRAKQPHRNSLMTKSEQKYLDRLPEKITIYRGMTVEEYKDGNFGRSWTLKKEKAEWFANKYIRNFATEHLEKMVHELVIDKSEVVAFLNGRKEFEIIYIHDPKKGKGSKK